MAKRSGAVGSSLYNQCQKDKNKNKEKTLGLVPRTKACYQVAEDFTTLSYHQVEVRFASVPPPVEKTLNRLGRIARLPLLPYWNGEDLTVVRLPTNQDVGLFRLDISFLPEEEKQQHQMLNVVWSVNNTMERYDRVVLPVRLLLPSASLSFSSRFAYHLNGRMP